MRKGQKHSVETLKKMSEAHKRFKHSAETRKKMSEQRKGRKLSSEHKKKIGDAHKGKNLSKEHIKKMVEGRRGKPLSAEHREKISDSHKGVKLSKEHRIRMSEARVGNKNPWKGDVAGVSAMHMWVVLLRGRPSYCEHCGKTGGGTRQYHWANVDHKYRRKIDDYLRLCIKCHGKYDGENNLRKHNGNYPDSLQSCGA